MDDLVHSGEDALVVKQRAKRYTLEAVDSARAQLLDAVYAGCKRTTKASIRELFPYLVVSRKLGVSWERLAHMMTSQGLSVTPQTLAKYYTEFRSDRELPHVKRLIKQLEQNKEMFDIRRSLMGAHADIAVRAEEALREASKASRKPQKPLSAAPSSEASPERSQAALLPKLLADAVAMEKRGHCIPEVTSSLILRGKYVYHAETGEPFLGPISSHQARLLEKAGRLH